MAELTREDLREELRELKTDLRTEFRADLKDFRTEIKAELKAEIVGLRVESKQQLVELRMQIRKETDAIVGAAYKRVVDEITEVMRDLAQWMSEKVVEIQEQNSRTQGMIGGVHNRLNDYAGRIVVVEKKVRRITQS